MAMRPAWLWGGIAVIMFSTGVAIFAFLIAELAGFSSNIQRWIALTIGLISVLIVGGAWADYTLCVLLVPNQKASRREAHKVEINLGRLIFYPLYWSVAIYQRCVGGISQLDKHLIGQHRNVQGQDAQRQDVQRQEATASNQVRPQATPSLDETGSISATFPTDVQPQSQPVRTGNDLGHDALIENDPGIRAMNVRLTVVPTDADTCWDLARRYVSLGGYQQAIERYKTVLHYRPEFHEARFELIDCYRKMHDWDQALKEADYLLGVPRLAAEARRAIALIQRDMGTL